VKPIIAVTNYNVEALHLNIFNSKIMKLILTEGTSIISIILAITLVILSSGTKQMKLDIDGTSALHEINKSWNISKITNSFINLDDPNIALTDVMCLCLHDHNKFYNQTTIF
jgi:hypothetical protein